MCLLGIWCPFRPPPWPPNILNLPPTNILNLRTPMYMYIGPPPREREKEREVMNEEKIKCPNNPHPHLLQMQKALALVSHVPELVGRPGTGSLLPSTIAPSNHPKGVVVTSDVLSNFKCRGVLLIQITVGQESDVLTVGAGARCLDFSFVHHFSLFPPSFCDTARYRLKYCLRDRKTQNVIPAMFESQHH